MEEQLDRREEVNPARKRAILHDQQQLLHQHNGLVRLFRTALERMPNDDYKVVIRADKRPAGIHERQINALIKDEVAILIVGENVEKCDIVVTPLDTGQLQKIFWQGDDAYYFKINMINALNGQYQSVLGKF